MNTLAPTEIPVSISARKREGRCEEQEGFAQTPWRVLTRPSQCSELPLASKYLQPTHQAAEGATWCQRGILSPVLWDVRTKNQEGGS